MQAVDKLILDAVLEGTITGTEGNLHEYNMERSEAYPSDSWVMSVSVAPYNPDLHKPWFLDWSEDEEDIAEAKERMERLTADEGTPTHMCRIVTRSQWDEDSPLELVDGGEIYLQVDESTGTIKSIWEEVWEGNQPDYYGGPIPEAREWVRELPECSGELYLGLDNPFRK